jgi:hypothetical protein
MTRQHVQTFLNNLAERAPEDFQPLMEGIAEHFRVFGSISPNQAKPVRITAKKCRMIIPTDLEDNFGIDDGDDLEADAPKIYSTNAKLIQEIIQEIGEILVKAVERKT